jgi:cyclic pyranopterin phosphate synthase
MKDVSSKEHTLRTSTAEAKLTMPPEVLDLLRNRELEKGDALEIARSAGIMAAKKTWEIIPFCHPLMLTGAKVEYVFEEDGLRISTSVKTHGQTGVEMEALTAASVTALTLYDMLKPHTHEMQIEQVQLISKTGGKSGDYHANE